MVDDGCNEGWFSTNRDRYGRHENGNGLQSAGQFATDNGITHGPVFSQDLDERQWHRQQTEQQVADSQIDDENIA